MLRKLPILSSLKIVPLPTISEHQERFQTAESSYSLYWHQCCRFFLLSTLVVLVLLSGVNGVFAQTNYTRFTITDLNLLLAQGAGVPILVANDTVTLTSNVPLGWIITDTTAITGGSLTPAYTLLVQKQGQGVWRLNNGLNSSTATNNTFSVNAGTLELMKDTSITLGGTTLLFNLQNGTTLNARGATSTAAVRSNVITAPVTIGNGVTIGLDLTNMNTGAPVLQIAGNVSTDPVINFGTINLLGFRDQQSVLPIQQILQYDYTGTGPPPIRVAPDGTFSPPLDNFQVLVRGEAWEAVKLASGGRLSGTIAQAAPVATATGFTSTISIANLISHTGSVTWRGSVSNIWNATTANWSGAGSNFLHGDIATFDSTGQNKDIIVQAGGVQIGEGTSASPFGMFITGGTYSFDNASGYIGIDGGGGVNVSATGPGSPTEVTFKSTNSYWGGTTIGSNATVILESSKGLGTGAVALNAGGKLIFDTTVTVPGTDIFQNNINGTGVGDIIKRGTNIVRLDGQVNTASNTTVESGTLQNNIGYGVLTVNLGAEYHAYSASRTIAGLKDGPLGGGTVDMSPMSGNGPYNLTITTAAATVYEFSGVIVGTGSSVTKVGSQTNGGEQIFSSDNHYGGTTTITGGILTGKRLVAPNAVVDITPFSTGDVIVDQYGTLQFDIRNSIAPGPNDAPGVARVANKITGVGAVEKSGNAVLSLHSTTSDYTGKTTVNAGYLRLENAVATGQTSEVNIALNAFLQLSNDASGADFGSLVSPYNRALTGAGNVEVLSGVKAFVSGYNELVVGSVTTVRPSTYTGTTTVYAGANLTLTDARGTGLTSKVILSDAPTASGLPAGILTLHFDKKYDPSNNEIEQIYNRTITGKGDLIKSGAGIATLGLNPNTNAENSYEGTTTVREGTLRLLYAGATGIADDVTLPVPEQSVEVQRGAYLDLAFAGEYHKGIHGNGSLIKSGEGTTTLKGFSSYTGGTYLHRGTLSFTGVDTVAGNIGLGGIFFQHEGGTLQNTETVTDLKQNVSIAAGATATFDTRAPMTINGSITNAAGGTGLSNFVKDGPSTLTLNGPTSWTGSTTIRAGRLYNNIPQNTALTVFNGAGYDTGLANRQVSAIHGDSEATGGTILTYKGYNFTVKYSDTTKPDIFAGSITGEGNLVFHAVGTIVGGQDQYVNLVLNGTNDYRGSTHITGLNGILTGSISSGTKLIIDAKNIYNAGNTARTIVGLEGFGTVDMANKNLTINQHDPDYNPEFYGSIINGKSLGKTGQGLQVLGGAQYTLSEDLQVWGGTLVFGSNNAPLTTVTVQRNLSVADETAEADAAVLAVAANTRISVGQNMTINGGLNFNTQNSLITAGSVKLGANSYLNVSGLGDNNEYVVIIRSGTAIEDHFGSVRIADSESTVDFLTVGVVKSDDKKEIRVGQTLTWYASQDAHGTFTLENASGSYTVGKVLEDVNGTFDPNVWDGKTLTKKGPGTLILNAVNSYTGATIIESGVLRLANEKATEGSSGIRIQGGSLQLDYNSRNTDGTWSEGLTTTISGTGGVAKVGYSTVSVLAGSHTYAGQTEVKQGTLLVDGTIWSRVLVNAQAGFGGNGTVNHDVVFEDKSFYYWRFGDTEALSDMLTVGGNLTIGDNVTFKPIANTTSSTISPIMDGWTVIQYENELTGVFAGIDSSSSAFYSFEFEYSEPSYARSYSESGFIKIVGARLDTPRALSDIVAVSQGMAQTKMHRSAFRQIAREWSADSQWMIPNNGAEQRGQNAGFYRTTWMNLVGRGDHFESNYFKDMYSFQSYGVQTGVSFLSSRDRSFGLLFGREEAKLSNQADRVDNEDYYLGLYYGQLFVNNIDVLAYIGGGWQKNDLFRQSSGRRYGSGYNGNTFNLSLQAGKRSVGPRGVVVRPYTGIDIEIVRIGSSAEKTLDGAISNEVRNYRRSELSQVFLKLGIEANKAWHMIDFRAGTEFSWNVGSSVPKTEIYYPYFDKSVLGYGADFGRVDWGINVGMNWYLTQRRNAMCFLDYDGVVHLDRDNKATGTGTLGFSWRF